MEEEAIKMHCKVFLNDTEKIANYFSLSSVDEKVENLYFCDSIQKIFSTVLPNNSHKSEVESSKLREEGNIQLQESNYKAAISSFSSAALVAPFAQSGESRSFSLALANRSFALLKLGEHNLAIDDIDLAIEAGYPEENRYKLIERKAKCLANTGRVKETEKSFNEALKFLEFSKCKDAEKQKIKQNLENQKQNMSITINNAVTSEIEPSLKSRLQDSNPKLPAFSDAIDLRYDDVRGRYGVATRDIEPGTVVLEEHPVAALLKPQHNQTHCDHCFSKVSTLPIPCRSCSSVRYCGGNCRNIAGNSYHQHECGVDDYLETFNKDFNDGRDLGMIHHRLCYRIITQNKLAFYKENIDNFTRSNNKSGTENGESAIFMPGGYQSMSDLVSHHDRMDEDTLLPLLLSAIVQLKMLQDTKYFTKELKENIVLTGDEKMMCKIIVHFLQVMKFNTHAILEAVLQDRQTPLLVDVRSVGCGVFPTLCLLNTSCDQNIAKYNEGTKVIGVVSKPIKKGEEISDNYYPTAAFLERTERRKWLKEHYLFDCECNACEENLPLLKDMPEDPIRFVCEKCGNKDISKDVEKCNNCGEKFVFTTRLKKVKELKDRITNTINIYSSSKTSDAKKLTEILESDYTSLRNIVAHPYKFLVVAEQQYLKSIKQVFGNNVFRKNCHNPTNNTKQNKTTWVEWY